MFQRSFGRALSVASGVNATSPSDYGNYLMNCLPKLISKTTEYGGELSLHCKKDGILSVLRFLRDHQNARYQQCQDITAVDWPSSCVEVDSGGGGRFELVYCLLSPQKNSRIMVRTRVGVNEGIETVSSIFKSALWAEREVFDMFGIIFEGHPDLRRILTDYGFQGHPLRKDFPMTGFTEIRYDEERKMIVNEKVQLAQQYRKFEFSNPWEESQN